MEYIIPWPMKYKTNFLSKVILRLDYDAISILQTDSKPDLSARIQNDFPNVEGKPIIRATFSLVAGTPGMQQETKATIWEHRNTNKARFVALSPEFLSIEYERGEFTVFDDFSKEVTKVYSIFNELYHPEKINRIGLRYINEIELKEGNALDWTGLLNDNIVTAAKAGLFDDMKMIRSMHQLQTKHNDINILFNYGIFNREFPNPVARREFILDFDCYIAERTSSGQILSRFTDLNLVAEKMFESSIEKGLRDIMGVFE